MTAAMNLDTRLANARVNRRPTGAQDFTKTTMAKAYSYTRFSTPEQATGRSYQRQTETAKRYAEQQGLDLDTELTFEDLGTSAFRGRNADVGALAAFLEAVENSTVERGSWLIVESLDRISRHIARRAVRVLESLVDAGITVVTLVDGKVYDADTLDNDPMAFMWAFMVAIRAHEESATKSKRGIASWEMKRQKATEKPLTAMCPSWLTLGDDGHWLVNEAKADTVRRIFEEAVAGRGQHQIAARRNADGTPTLNGGDGWYRSTIKKILENPAVIGTMVPHKLVYEGGKKRRQPLEPIENYYPAIIDLETWETVQAGRLKRKPQEAGTKGVAYTLAGLAKCPKCGGSMTRVVKGKKSWGPMLVCARAKRGMGCSYRTIPQAAVDEALMGDGVVNGVIQGIDAWSYPPAADESLREKIADTERQSDELDNRIAAILDEIERGNGSPTLAKRLEILEAEREDLLEELEELYPKERLSRPIGIQKRTREFIQAVNNGDDATTRNGILSRIVEAVVVDYEQGRLVFRWRHGGETEAPLRLL